jgi:hypothetical protein
MKLNDKQKQFLVDWGYITPKTLDSLTHKGWENYFIENFDWELDLHLNHWGMNDLVLTEKVPSYPDIDYEIKYDVMLNFQGGDLSDMLNLRQ